MKRELATAIGTAFVVTTGAGAAILGAPSGALAGALAGGLALAAASATFRRSSFNPLFDVACWAAGTTPWRKALASLVAQVAGAFVGAAVLLFLLKSKREGYDVQALGLGAAGFGERSPGHFDWLGVALAEGLLGFVLGLAAVQNARREQQVGPWILGGLYAACNLVALPLTGGSLHSAQNAACAAFTSARAASDLWAVALLPLVAAAAAGLASRWLLRED